MITNCGKVVQKFVKKSAQKTCSKIVEKYSILNILHSSNKFSTFSHSFAQLFLTYKNNVSNLLKCGFYTFSTDTTNTIIYIGRF